MSSKLTVVFLNHICALIAVEFGTRSPKASLHSFDEIKNRYPEQPLCVHLGGAVRAVISGNRNTPR